VQWQWVVVVVEGVMADGEENYLVIGSTQYGGAVGLVGRMMREDRAGVAANAIGVSACVESGPWLYHQKFIRDSQCPIRFISSNSAITHLDVQNKVLRVLKHG
jgi:hypothetical protein